MENKRKTVLITGASGDLGYDLSLLFARNNYDLILHYFSNEENILKLKNEINSLYGVNVIIKRCDISKEKDVIDMFSDIDNVDVLINNAAYCDDDLFYLKDINTVKRVIDVNLIGTYLVSREATKKMDSGVIINVSSNNGIDNNYPESMDYDMSKAGIISLTNNLADLFAPKIRVVTVAPGWIDTLKNEDIDVSFKQKQLDKILLNRFASTEEIGEVILFLVNASYINKTVIKIDGGLRG